MRKVLLVLACFYLLSWPFLLWQGMFPAFPLSGLVDPFKLVGPFAVCLVGGAEILRRWLPRLAGSLALAFGLGLLSCSGFLLLFYPWPALTIQVLAGLLAPWLLWNHWRSFLGVTVCVAVGTLAVWNWNYVVGKACLDRAHDPAFFAFDLAVFRGLGMYAGDGASLYPLCRQRLVVFLLEGSYLMLFCQMFLVPLVLLRSRGDTGKFLAAQFGCYGVALVVFFIYPVVGPYYLCPQCLDPAFHGGITHLLIKLMQEEYAAVQQGTELSGAMYVIGMPSLHVALALLMQVSLRRHRFLFGLFLPVNLLMIASTVLLGFHYLLDVPAGILLLALVLSPSWLPRLRARRRQLSLALEAEWPSLAAPRPGVGRATVSS